MPVVAPQFYTGNPMSGVSAYNTGPSYDTAAMVMGPQSYSSPEQWDSYSQMYGADAATLLYGPRPGGSVQPATGSNTMWGQQGVSGGGSGITSIATGGQIGQGPYKADAQIAQLNSQFADILKRGLGTLNEQAALSGGFSGGIPYDKRQKYTTDIGLQQASAIERLMNDITGRNQAWFLDQQRQNSSPYSSGEGVRFGSANDSYDIMSLFDQMKGDSGGPVNSGGYGSQTSPGTQIPTYSRRDASSDFYRKYGRWPNTSELDEYYRTGQISVPGTTTDQSDAARAIASFWGF